MLWAFSYALTSPHSWYLCHPKLPHVNFSKFILLGFYLFLVLSPWFRPLFANQSWQVDCIDIYSTLKALQVDALCVLIIYLYFIKFMVNVFYFYVLYMIICIFLYFLNCILFFFYIVSFLAVRCNLDLIKKIFQLAIFTLIFPFFPILAILVSDAGFVDPLEFARTLSSTRTAKRLRAPGVQPKFATLSYCIMRVVTVIIFTLIVLSFHSEHFQNPHQ